MERKIGEIFEYNGEWYQCVKGDMYDYCKGCPSFENLRCTNLYGNKDCWLKATCEKLEKVGEPIEFARGLYFQRYRLVNYAAFYEGDTRLFFNAPTKTFVYIEIKTKEDMEEKKLNLKPFDIQKAREGKPICTRDGRKARIICFDAKGDYPIVALIESGNIEGVQQYMIDGHCTKAMSECYGDLMMLPEKKEGWVNVYKDSVFDTKDEALIGRSEIRGYIDTIKISWEE